MRPGPKWCKVSLEEEFQKNPELNKKDLDRLREWILSQKHLPVIPDEMLVWFLHSCYFNLDKAQACIECFFAIRSSSPSLFNKRDVTDPEFRKYIDAVNVAMLPVPDPNGYHIFYHGLRDTDPAHYSHLYDNKLIFMATDAWLHRQGTAPGFILMVDMKGAKLGHITKISFTVLRLSTKYVQEGSPLRLKAIHVINTVSWIDKLLAIMRPFVMKEIFDLLHFHKEGSSTLHECIPKECLPSDLGGTLPSTEKLGVETVQMLEGLTDFFLEDEKIRIDESKRDKGKKKKSSAVEELAANHFNKLEID